MLPTRYQVLVLVVGLLSVGHTAQARIPDIEPIKTSYGDFNVMVSYDVEDAYAGNDGLLIGITVSTIGSQNLQLEKCESPDESKIQFSQLSELPERDPQTGLLKTDYSYRVDIKESADPRIYLVQLHFAYPGQEKIIRPFRLY